MNVNAKGYEEMDEIYRRKLKTEQYCNYMHKWNDSFRCLWQAYEMRFVTKQPYTSELSEIHSCYNVFVGVMQLNNAIRN